MGAYGELLPGRSVPAEDDGMGQRWRFGPIDPGTGVIEVHRDPPPRPPPLTPQPEQEPPVDHPG